MSFGGAETVADLADIVRVIDYERAQLEAIAPSVRLVWEAKDRAASDQWASALGAVSRLYDSWRQGVLTYIAAVPDAVQVFWPQGAAPPGDLFTPFKDYLAELSPVLRGYQDLDYQLRKAGMPAPKYEHMPQPTRPDIDLELFKFAKWATTPATWGQGLAWLVVAWWVGSALHGGAEGAVSGHKRRRLASGRG